MTYRPPRMKFGLFMAPFHRSGENPTLALRRNLDLIEHLDRLGYDEVWIGEHHSGTRETIADPAIFIAAAAERTQRIKLGTGVSSLPYHHPFMLADQMNMLDHLTQGRAMFGVGPGLLASDAYQLGIEPPEQRRMMAEALDVILRLLRGETVTEKTDWYELRDARLQLPSYTFPHLPVAVASSTTPAGPTQAGKHGLGLLSVAGASHETFERTWAWVEEAAAESGKTVDRADWRVVISFHLADTKDEAIADLEARFPHRAYVGDGRGPGVGLFASTDGTVREQIEATPNLIVGTPDDAVKAVESIVERSGGLGGVLATHHEWADTANTYKSYELWARHVAPHFQGMHQPLIEQRDWFDASMGKFFARAQEATERAFSDAGKELTPEIREQMRVIAERRAARETAARDGGNGDERR